MPDYVNCEMIALINCHIHNERNRRILKRRLVDGIKYEKLASEFGLSRNQVCNIVKAGKEILFPLLEQEKQNQEQDNAGAR